ncbi:MAG: DMT family transporter [Bacillota bacterium]|uniref:DMT family transporter n=1 Tax=Virgibacillus salarius TaxID=447199 RepID=A0A941DV10_9BACI|nr:MULTISPECIES: DMT family transporter [Bacillaceae]NAZ08944.1 EamA family transporter [Agaribacter marinus]MBR7796236.1 DMT family transporter [Virgibacillus salarius]MCC2251633.1 DMT family transporter [Virgibacillus sp. AGTR]MDY7045145.1 DMT family transporter [Virgibacillus sp. M23]QRZ19667.1 DMT family transporter [Virgibacillus sp. AGTR]
MRLPPFNPYIAVVIGVISVSTSAIFVRLADQAPASIIANYRLVFAVLLMAPIILLKYRHELKLINRKDWLLSILAGVFLAFHFILWFESLNFTSVASSVVLVSLQPIFAFLGTYFFFQERFSSGAVISMLIALIGSIIISWGDFKISGMALYGDILALGGAITVTAYFLLGQRVRRSLSLMSYTFVVYSVSAITLILYNLAFQHPFFGYPADHWWVFLALAIIPTFLGHTLFNWALKWLSTATISMGIVFEPVGASILAYIILEEKVTAFQLLGGTIVLFGLFLFILSTNQKKKVTIAKKEQQD